MLTRRLWSLPEREIGDLLLSVTPALNALMFSFTGQ